MTESSFRQLLLRLALIPILSLCVVLAVLGLELHQISLRRTAGSQATAVLLQSNLLQKSLIDQESGIRGYLASKNPLFLQPYREASSRLGADLARLRSLVSFDPASAEKVAQISAGYGGFDEINRNLLRENLSDESVADLLGKQKQSMDALRIQFADLDSAQNDIRSSTRYQLSELFGRLPAIGLGGGVLVAALLLYYGVRLFREISVAYHEQLVQTAHQRDSLNTTLQSIGDAVMVCDERGNLSMLNPAAEQLTGWATKDALGRPLIEVFQIINEHTRLPVENPVDKVRRLNSVVALENHTVLIRKDGAEVPIDDSGAPIRDADGGIAGVVLVFRSVAERRRAMDLVRQSQERLNSIYSTSLEYIGILSTEGRLLDCNRASLEFAANTREDVVGKFFWECPWFLYTDGMPEVVRTAVERAAAGEPLQTELALIRPSGETVHFDFSLTPVYDAAGNVTYLVPEGRDISDLKKAQLALIQSEKLAAVGRLASSIAHEINNPLEAVTNLLYLAQTSANLPEVQSYLATADHELRRVSIIANQTLRFHKQSSSPQPVEAAELFSSVLGIYEGRLRNSGVTVEVSHRAHQPIVCFAGDVRQVLNNLVGNAIDAMSNRGGRLLMRSHDGADWSTGRKGIVLTVADTGSGISKRDEERVFEPFFTTKDNAGTGLGLWVSKEVVSRHHGVLKLRSSSNTQKSGTVFRFFLPYA